MAKHSGRLELTWTNKHLALLSAADGKYDYTWADPQDYRVSEVRLFREMDRVDAKDGRPADSDLPEPTSDNLLITGDAMHALRSLTHLPEFAGDYLGKVRLVYIDPPFNTGQTFNRYEDGIEHSIWLTMLRDRIRQLKPLLAPDASVWVHLDDVEVHRMRSVLDEEMGESGFITQITWQKRTTRENRSAFSESHDTILVYSPMPATQWRHVRNLLPRTGDTLHDDGDGRGAWVSVPFTAPGTRKNQMYTIETPTGVKHEPPKGRCWGAIETEYQKLLADGRIHFPRKGDGRPRVKQFESEMKGLVPHTIWTAGEVGTNDAAKKGLLAFFPDGDEVFDTPKPEQLLARIVEVATNPGDLVLDCFAGSGTTAAVAHKLGRRWVTVELQASNVRDYTRPRLESVVTGTDQVGIGTITVRVPEDGVDLPDGMSPEAAKAFQSALSKVIDDDNVVEVDAGRELAAAVRAARRRGGSPLGEDETKAMLSLLAKLGDLGILDVGRTVKSTLRKRTATRDKTTRQWYGGGGFAHLEVGPSMFDEVEGIVVVADWAVDQELARAVCAQVGVRYRPESIFAGRRGRTRIVVLDAMVGQSTVKGILDQLPEGELVEVWSTQATPEAAQTLVQLRPGSTLQRIPESVLDTYRAQLPARRRIDDRSVAK